MICNKGRGSLEKHPGRTGILGYGPLDRDLVAQDGSGLDLIWRADSGSGGQGWVGARDGGAGHRSPLLRGGATRGSPDLAKSGRPGVKSTRSGSGVTYRARAVHLGPKRSSGRLGWGSSTARAARWQRGSPGLAGSGPYGAPRANTSSAKGMAGLGLLTKVWSGWGRDAGGAGGEIRQRTRVELRGPSGAGLLRAWIPSNQSA